MRAIGLTALLLSVLIFLFPFYHIYVPFIRLRLEDTRILGGLLLAVGALTLAIYARQEDS